MVFILPICKWTECYYTSLEKKEKRTGQVGYDVNTRAILAFREIGRGYSALCEFAMNMNMTAPVTKKNYSATNGNLLLAYIDAAKAYIKIAAEEIIESAPRDEMDVANCAVSVDGT